MNIKKSATKLFQVYLSIVYDSFILELSISILVLALHCYCGDTDYVKYELLSKHLFQIKRQHGG